MFKSKVQPIVIREYESSKKYEKDARKMAKKGYIVHSVEPISNKKSGLGIAARAVVFAPMLLSRNKDKLLVTYRHITTNGENES